MAIKPIDHLGLRDLVFILLSLVYFVSAFPTTSEPDITTEGNQNNEETTVGTKSYQG